jgi:hypothetical protein
MHIVMYIGLGAIFVLVGYWVGVRRLQKGVQAGYAERDHKTREAIHDGVKIHAGVIGIHTRMSAQVLRVTYRSDRAIAVVQAFLMSCDKIDDISEQRSSVLESEEEHARRVLSEVWFRPAVLSETARIERK